MKEKKKGYYFVCLNYITKRQSFIGWLVLVIEKHELGVDYTGAIKTFVCLHCIERQSFIKWLVWDIEKHELGVDYTGTIKTACIQ